MGKSPSNQININVRIETKCAYLTELEDQVILP